jgi:hypothetical protein
MRQSRISKGRTGGEGRSQKARRQDGGQPETPARQAAVQKAVTVWMPDRPGDGQVDQRFQPPLVVGAVALGFQHVPADHDVQEQVAVEHDHVPEQHGVGRRVKNHVEHAHGLPEVHQDEEQAHGDRRDGQKFAQDGDPAEGLVVVQVVGQHHHHAPGGHTDQKGELGDVESPGHVPAHAGDAETEISTARDR